MSDALETLPASASVGQLQHTLEKGLVAIVADHQGFHGLITRFDLLNHLRRHVA